MKSNVFFERASALCSEQSTTMTALLKKLGLSTSKGTAWKKGSTPKGDVVAAIAHELGTTSGYLLGEIDDPSLSIKKESVTENGDGLSQEFKSLYAKLTPNQKDLVVATMREMTKDK